jgi:hypothetical protein
MTPLYQHDCTTCRFLGCDDPQPGEPRCNGVDMYIHDGLQRMGPFTAGPCVVRRYSSEGGDYGSWSVDAFPIPGKYQRVIDAWRKQQC